MRRRDATRWLQLRLVPATALLVLAYVFTLLLWSPVFDIADVTVQGDVSLAEQIKSASGVLGTNLFSMQTGAVRASITNLPDVKSVSMTPVFPHRVDVRITAYVPVALWRSGGIAYLVTEDGFVIKAASPSITGGMVIVDDPRPIQLAHGDQVDARSIQAAETIRSLFAVQSLSASRFIALEGSTIAVERAPGEQVLFNLRLDLDRQVKVLAQVVRRGIAFSILDLRAGDSPYYR